MRPRYAIEERGRSGCIVVTDPTAPGGWAFRDGAEELEGALAKARTIAAESPRAIRVVDTRDGSVHRRQRPTADESGPLRHRGGGG